MRRMSRCPARRASPLSRATQGLVTDSLDQYLAALAHLKPPSRDQELALARRAQAGDLAARDELVARNARFVVRVARQYAMTGLPLQELIAEGNLGLVRAAERYDPDRGVKFISYAVWWIRQAIQSALTRHGRPVRIPLNRGLDLHHLLRQQAALAQTLGRPATRAELACATGLRPAVIESLLGAAAAPVRIDAQTGDEDGIPMAERLTRLADETDPTAPVLEAENRSLVAAALASLPPREAAVLRLYYGVGDPEEQTYTLEQIGRQMGVTRERVRQLRDRGVERLRVGPFRELLRPTA